MKLSGKVALVTGARGIGGASAKLLAERGATVIVAYRQNQAAAQTLIDEISAKGGSASATQLDLAERDEVERAAGEIQQRWGRLDILVSNAGGGWIRKPFDQLSWQEYAGVVDSELKAAFDLTKAILPVMKAQKSGRLIYMASTLALHVLADAVASSTAKAALLAFVRNIAVEVGPFGITANAVLPGLVLTEASADMPPAAQQAVAARTPLGHVATAEEIAGVVAFLAGDDSRFMTGTSLVVDGGMSLVR